MVKAEREIQKRKKQKLKSKAAERLADATSARGYRASIPFATVTEHQILAHIDFHEAFPLV